MPAKSEQPKRTHPANLSTGRKPRGLEVAGGYAELRCRSNFSFLRGASHPEELAERAAELGYAALALTDRNTLAGVVRMHCAARDCSLKLIVGAEIAPVDAPPLLLYAPDRSAYGRLARIITRGRMRSKKGACAIALEDIAELHTGLLAVVPVETVGRASKVEQTSVESENGVPATDARLQLARSQSSGTGSFAKRLRALQTYRELFGDRLYLAVSVHGGGDDAAHLARAARLGRECKLPLIACNDVYYHEPQRRFLQDVLTCVRAQCTISEAGARLFANGERHLKPIAELRRLFGDYLEALARTVELAARCTFKLDELRYEYPECLCPADSTPGDYLACLTWEGARARYPQGVSEKVRALIEHELELIRTLQYEPYFLTVWDIVQFARGRGILCQGRGSAANSVVCYCLGITNVDPERIDVLFERFVSAERNEPPDIDVDFEHERREEVFQYIYEKYGRERAGIVAEVITYRPRSAIRDVGKALGLSLDKLGVLAKRHDWWSKEALAPEVMREVGLDPENRTLRLLAKLVKQVLGFPRHLSQHVGGFVITRGPLCELVPLENAAMPNRTFIEWDKDDIDALGILKIDCLSLGMLTAIRKALTTINNYELRITNYEKEEDTVEANGGEAGAELQIHTIPAEDPAVYDMICRADTVGVFQIESRAQMSMLPRLKPRCFYDLVIEVAIVRPGPIQGKMVHPYLRRRNGEEAVSYPSEALKEVLHKTLGVPLFQEQAMRLAVVGAGFSPGEADQLRRAMGAWRRRGVIEKFRTRLVEGMKVRGLKEEFAERCFEQICGFGEYGFPESHAASFAFLVYVSAWLKRYHPAVFCMAVINSQPMGFYQPAQLVRDAREHGVEVLPIDVNFSGYDCRLEHVNGKGRGGRRVMSAAPKEWGRDGPAVRLGMRLVRGISEAQVAGIEEARREGAFKSVPELARRAGLRRASLARLAAADALRSLGRNRRGALWEVLALKEEPPLLDELEPREAEVPLPNLKDDEIVCEDYEMTGLSLHAHPLSLIRKELHGLRVKPARALQHARQGQWMKVAGLVLVRQRPGTALGMLFYTLEDETGVANLVVRSQVYEKYRPVARGATALVAEGRVERQGEVVHLQVKRFEDVARLLSNLRSTSRDFH